VGLRLDDAEPHLLDTSAYAHFRRGHADVVDLLATAEQLFLSAVTLGELEAGFILGSRADENRRALRDFLSEPFVTVVDVSDAVAVRYGALFASLRRAGTPVPTNDIWIASCALHVRAQLITFDSDFERFVELDRRVLAASRP
jgi:tRNA(fMet)-specific endonuclease VapC